MAEVTKRTKDHRIVILGFQYWGSGETLAQAKSNFRNSGGKLSDGYFIYTFDADSEFLHVDMMGGINYKGNAPDKIMVTGKRLKAPA